MRTHMATGCCSRYALAAGLSTVLLGAGLLLGGVGCQAGGTIGGTTGIEDIDDIVMPDGTGSACFVEKPADQLGVSCKLRVKDFDSSATLDQRILDEIHLAKAALSEQPNHAVISKELADFH